MCREDSDWLAVGSSSSVVYYEGEQITIFSVLTVYQASLIF